MTRINAQYYQVFLRPNVMKIILQSNLAIWHPKKRCTIDSSFMQKQHCLLPFQLRLAKLSFVKITPRWSSQIKILLLKEFSISIWACLWVELEHLIELSTQNELKIGHFCKVAKLRYPYYLPVVCQQRDDPNPSSLSGYFS